jgi:hypothetical protein
MNDPIMRTVECPYCLRHSVNVTYEAGLDDDGNRVEREVARAKCSTSGCIGAKLPPR